MRQNPLFTTTLSVNCAWLVYIQLVTKNHLTSTILLENHYVYVRSKYISIVLGISLNDKGTLTVIFWSVN